MKLFSKNPDPYAHIVEFIDAAVESPEISAWLADLESEPGHMRSIRLAEIRNRMAYDQAPEQHIEIIELMNNASVLQAMNKVVKTVHQSGMSTRKFIKKKDPANFNTLISLIAANLESPERK